MPATPSPYALPVADILDRPGSSRPLALELAAPADLDLPLAEVVGPLRLDGVLESVVDGILVRGSLDVPLALSCARCLAPVHEDARVDVVELFSDPAATDDPADVERGYEVADGAIDLDTLLRDALGVAVPIAAHCRPDCRGLCPTCGVDRNVADCDCVDQPMDRRWAALEGLSLGESRVGESRVGETGAVPGA